MNSLIIRTLVFNVLCFALALIYLASPVNGQTVVFEDDFSSGTFEKWQQVRSSNITWEIIDGRAYVTVPTGSTLTELVPKDEYWSSDWKDLIYELDYSPLAGADKNISFNFEDIHNWYEIHFVGGGYEMARVKNGKVVWSVGRSYTVANDQVVHFKIIINQGNIQIFMNDLEIANDTDPTFNQNYGKIGLKAGTGSIAPTTVWFDNIKVTLLNDAPGVHLDVPSFKQTDTAWSEQEYDTAHLWSEESFTIGRWGCAVTSLAMILHHYGITSLPDGTVLDPSTLNAWLLSQPDGYVGDGLVNWIAATRMTRTLSPQLGTPKLEYTRVADTTLATSLNEINNFKPVILEIPGHFLVADGITADQTDLFIKDPSFAHTHFSQHEQPIVSTRTFQPSFTDLSYLLIVHNPQLAVSFTQSDGNMPSGITTFASQLSADNELPAQSPPSQLLELPKPESGEFFLEVSQTKFGEFSIEIYAYDAEGNVTVLSQTGVTGRTPTRYKINYSKTGTSTLSQIVTFALFQELLAEQKSVNGIEKFYAQRTLDRISGYAESQTRENQLRYVALLNFYLSWYTDVISPSSRGYLEHQLHILEAGL